MSTAAAERILFSRTNTKYGFLSNFAAYPITVGGLVYPTSEHYFQSVKFIDAAYAEHIRTKCATAAASKKAGGSRKHPIQPDWNTSRIDVMLVALRAKFSQHADIRARLIETDDAELVEHAAWDKFWGDGGVKGGGQNMLGKLLMQVRGEVQGNPTTATTAPAPKEKATTTKQTLVTGNKRPRSDEDAKKDHDGEIEN